MSVRRERAGYLLGLADLAAGRCRQWKAMVITWPGNREQYDYAPLHLFEVVPFVLNLDAGIYADVALFNGRSSKILYRGERL